MYPHRLHLDQMDSIPLSIYLYRMYPHRLYFDQMGSIPHSIHRYLMYHHRLHFDQMVSIPRSIYHYLVYPHRLYFDQMGSIPWSICHYLVYPHRLYFDQMGGIELDVFGARKRRWLWKDQETHVHAPPFQPICLRLNHNNSVRVMTQEAIALTFRASKRSCRFTVGARLKVRVLLCLVLPLC